MTAIPLTVDDTDFRADSSLITVDSTVTESGTVEPTGSLFFNDAGIAFNDESLTWSSLGDVIEPPVIEPPVIAPLAIIPRRGCTPMRFGIENSIPTATLSATPAPDTKLDWLKNEGRARQVVWLNPMGDIVITGEIPEIQIGEYFSLPGSNLLGQAQVKLELFADPSNPVDVLNMPFTQIAQPIPLGQWRVAIDPYGIPREIDRPAVFLYWFDKPLAYKSFRLTIQRSEYADGELTNVSLRMFIIGQMIEMDYNFAYGSPIRFMTPPELVQTAGGSWIPSRAQTRSRALSLDLNQMSDNDRARLWEMESTLQGRPFIISAFPASEGWQFSNYSFLARFSNALEFSTTFEDIHAVNNLNMVEV